MFSRSIYKLFGLTNNYKQFSTFIKNSDASNKNSISLQQSDRLSSKKVQIIFWNTSVYISSSILNKKIGVYNGRFFSVFQIRPSMLHIQLRNFVRTKKLGKLIHLKKKKYV